MEGYWPIFFLLVVLKVPAIFMIYLLYWAARNDPESGVVDEGEDGGQRRRPRPLQPRGPRRGPHGGGTTLPSDWPARRPKPAVGQVLAGGRQAEAARARERERARSRESSRK